jgi:hypothetical protein
VHCGNSFDTGVSLYQSTRLYENFLKLLMRSMRGDVWDHIASQKNDHGLSYRHYEASQRRSSPKITICEIFGVVRFSTFSTASAKTGSGPAYSITSERQQDKPLKASSKPPAPAAPAAAP